VPEHGLLVVVGHVELEETRVRGGERRRSRLAANGDLDLCRWFGVGRWIEKDGRTFRKGDKIDRLVESRGEGRLTVSIQQLRRAGISDQLSFVVVGEVNSTPGRNTASYDDDVMYVVKGEEASAR